MHSAVAGTPRARTRLYQLAAIVVSTVAIGAVLIAVLGSGSTSELRPGRPVPGQGQTLALFAGIPQHGTVLGDPHAPVTLVEFSDLQCPTCAEFAMQALPAVVSRYVRPGRVQLIFRGLDSIGRDSERAARMAAAVGEQGRLWQFVDLMYRNQGAENTAYVTDTYLRALAAAIPGVDVERALTARSSPAVQAQLEAATTLAGQLHLASTPSFLIARGAGPLQTFSPGGLDSGSFEAALNKALAGG